MKAQRFTGANSGHSLLLYMLAFGSGTATMAIEMAASRLLAPYFGNSLPVWSVLIGVLLASMAAGYLLGGRLADRHAQPALLFTLTGWAGLATGLIPYVAHPILYRATTAFEGYQAGLIAATLLGVLVLLVGPVLLLSCISPFVTRLLLPDVSRAGNTAGRIYALSTAGSLLGTLLPVFVLIPTIGTRRTFGSIAFMLLALTVAGLVRLNRRSAVLFLVLWAAITALLFAPQLAIKPTPGLLYEGESLYNYIQVLQAGDDVLLKLNEGEGIQSVYNPGRILTGYVYDYFLLAPWFRPVGSAPVSAVCLIGLAGGTIARQYQALFPGVHIDGVELDPHVIEIGRRYLGLGGSGLRAIAADGRQYLATTSRQYDVIILDAYRPPYIPFQLTTREFFTLARDHLKPAGLIVVNVARTETDYTLVDAIATTLHAVLPQVYILDTRSDLNSIVVACSVVNDWATIEANLAALQEPLLRDVVARASGGVRKFTPGKQAVLTDDLAPVERIVHGLILRYLFGHSTNEVSS